MRSILCLCLLALALEGVAAANQRYVKTQAGIKVYSLVNLQGSFESSPAGQRPGWRTVGFWSFDTPKPGDVLVKRGNAGGLSLWALEHVTRNFEGSNGDRFWTGLMRDLVFTNTATQAHTDAVHEAARSLPEILPRR